MNTIKHRFGGRIRRGLIVLMTALGLTAGVGVISATPASAEPGYYVLYPVEATSVCRHQGNTGATSFDWGNPYSLTCYDLSIPAGVSFGGDLDIQGYCDWKWPGSVAKVHEWNIFGWKCERREKP